LAGFPEYLRIFTAVEISAAGRREIATEARVLLEGLGRIGLVSEENLHVTLKFVGDVHRDDLPALTRAVADAAKLLSPGEIELEGIGAFPRLDRPRVIWAGVSDPSGILDPVHARLNDVMKPFGARREVKKYVPHVTLGRVRSPIDGRRLTRTVEEAGEIWFSSERVEGITLFMSELTRGGPPRYTVLGRYVS
jgi:RNA 2',3'-cyclic 3'-phosphodiesterase